MANSRDPKRRRLRLGTEHFATRLELIDAGCFGKYQHLLA